MTVAGAASQMGLNQYIAVITVLTFRVGGTLSALMDGGGQR